ncbi:MAG: hypothetical protein SNJ33_06255 [Rikenellaceae bacterium]
MSYIESAKSYTGNTLEEIFFRPMLKADAIQDLGIRMLYNMPLPTTIQLWSSPSDPLYQFDSDNSGWSGGSSSTKEQKVLDMTRIKAEMAFSAHDYFSLVFENITSRSDVNFEDLTGTELEKAETELFRQALQEAIRVTMWIGDGNRSKDYNSFMGFVTLANNGVIDGEYTSNMFDATDISSSGVYSIFDTLWNSSSEELKSLKSDGELALFVSSDIYYSYEKYLETSGTEAAYSSIIDGRRELYFRGIPVVDIRVGKYKAYTSNSSSFAMLVDKRNMVVAFNTADLPSAEVRMWYNPDEMENRQRAVFMIGCDFIDSNLLTVARFL